MSSVNLGEPSPLCGGARGRGRGAPALAPEIRFSGAGTSLREGFPADGGLVDRTVRRSPRGRRQAALQPPLSALASPSPERWTRSQIKGGCLHWECLF